MSLSKIPVEVVEGHVFKYLSWNDLLRLRRVSKECRALVQDYMKTHKAAERAPEISVGLSNTDEHPNFESFLEMEIPTRKIYLRNTHDNDDNFSPSRRDVHAFLEKTRGTVKHLRLHQFSLYRKAGPCAGSWELVQELTNLESLRVDDVLLGYATRRRCHRDPTLPPLFKNLKALELHVNRNRANISHENDYEMIRRLIYWLTHCTSLQRFRLSVDSLHVWFVKPTPIFQVLSASLEAGREWESLELNINPGCIIVHRENEPLTAYHRLLAACTTRKVALGGVHSSWLQDRIGVLLPAPGQQWIPSSITDLRVAGDYDPSLLRRLKLEALKTLEIDSRWGREGHHHHEGTCWSPTTLTTLKLNLNNESSRDVTTVFRQLNEALPLDSLAKVTLTFEWSSTAYFALECWEHLVNWAPNLKELTLVRWRGPPEALAQLWSRIPGLQKLSLVKCLCLEDHAFLGDDCQNPAFLQLTNLRHLTVRNAQQWGTGLTANLFAKVVRHMSLTHLDISSEEDTWEFQDAWLALMQGGHFAKSIEEIKWNGCRLHRVQDPELREIGKAFRCYNML